MMKWLVAVPIILGVAVFGEAFAEQGTYVDSIKFIQYLDENIALEEVRNGNLDIYYWTIPSDRLEGKDAQRGLHVFNSTGGSFSMLVNPAETEQFNPFADRDARFALNYLVDRKLFVNELMGGFGAPTVSYYDPSHPEYLTIIEQVEGFNFVYNPALAEEIISKSMIERGAVKADGMWLADSAPVEITIFIRSDDPIRKSIGAILASELERIGFTVSRDFGDLNKAFAVVYGSDPAGLQWHLYTEGWGSSAFVRYDSVGIGQMYAPWFSSMPGFNDPTYWNYENEKLDSLTQKIYTGNYSDAEERASLIQDGVTEGISESVRIFLASNTDQYVVNEGTSGIINDFGAGVPSRFTPINARSDDGDIAIGVKHIYQGSWNPVAGLTDLYSNHIWGILSDPATFKHPYTGETFPVRADYQIETAGPDGKLDLPDGAITWDPQLQEWTSVPHNASATSKATFDFKFSKWHNGEWMDMNDIMYSLYFVMEWGSEAGENDKTFDSSFTPRASQYTQTIIGVNPVDADTIEVYVDYWHFDENEIADWAALWSSVPWEITAAMEDVVIDGKASFSRSAATSKGISWLSLLIPNDAGLVRESLLEFSDEGHVPAALDGLGARYLQDRYGASAAWIAENDHAVISNGPFYLDSYSPEARTIRVSAFDDESYPFPAGQWSKFEEVKFPTIRYADVADIVQKGEALEIEIGTEGADSVIYFLTSSSGEVISQTQEISADRTVITVSAEDTQSLGIGAGNIKIFAASESVLKPDFYESSFLVVDDSAILPTQTTTEIEVVEAEPEYGIWIALLVAITIGIGAYLGVYKRRQSVKA